MIVSLVLKLIIILILTVGGSIVLSTIFYILDLRENTNKQLQYKDAITLFSYSAWIGYFERILIYGLFTSNNIISLSILIALKSVIRYPEINQSINEGQKHKLNAEKFLLGTLFSIVYTFIIYYLINIAFNY